MATPKDVVRQAVEFGHVVAQAYIGDLNDKDLLVRSVPGTNHIAWQLGHIIISLQGMLAALGHKPPELPKNFEAAYTKETASSDDPSKFASKDEYVRLLDQMKAASLAAIDKTPDSALDQPGPEDMRAYAPTVSSVLLLLGNHILMHTGQWVPIRRKLGHPPLF